jgi:hypothetical protein
MCSDDPHPTSHTPPAIVLLRDCHCAAEDVAKPYVREVLKQRLQDEYPEACEDEAALDAAMDAPRVSDKDMKQLKHTEGLVEVFFRKMRSQAGNKSTTAVRG